MFLFFLLFQLCEDLFTKINYNTDNSMSYSVEVKSSAPPVYTAYLNLSPAQSV